MIYYYILIPFLSLMINIKYISLLSVIQTYILMSFNYIALLDYEHTVNYDLNYLAMSIIFKGNDN